MDAEGIARIDSPSSLTLVYTRTGSIKDSGADWKVPV